MTMDRRRAMLWMMLIGSVMFTSYTLWPSGKPAPVRPAAAAANAPSAATPAATPAAAPAAPPATPLPEQEWATWRAQVRPVSRDPFFTVSEIAAMNRAPVAVRVEAAPPAPPPDYVVKLVVMSGPRGKAMIGNRVVQVGDMLGDERVAEIQHDGVVLEKGGERRRLALASGEAKVAIVQLERNR